MATGSTNDHKGGGFLTKGIYFQLESFLALYFSKVCLHFLVVKTLGSQQFCSMLLSFKYMYIY